MNKNRLINAAKDCIAKFRATTFPLKNIAKDIIDARRLNSHDRKLLLDLVFAFAREINLIRCFIKESFRFASSMTAQQQDNYAIDLLSVRKNLVDEKSSALVLSDYETWLSHLKSQRYLWSLGPVIKTMLEADYKENALAIAEGLYQRAPKYLAIEQTKININSVEEALSEQNISYFKHPLSPSALGTFEINILSLPDHIKKHLWLMDAGSQIIAELIKPKPVEKVLDMCAGEGIKARYIAKHPCEYFAVDFDKHRLEKAKRTLPHLHYLCHDARNLPLPKDHFDWILLDAPCSGIGVLRRHYDLVLRLTKDDIKKYAELQEQLLKKAIHHLKPGGKLIYATCSLFAVENEQQIERLLQENAHVKSLQLADLVGENLAIFGAALDKNCLTLFPHIDNCDGFYCAALSKH
jgi:16S rRNA C967 or C1407 C5-methylase (RsmB/RsmF family)